MGEQTAFVAGPRHLSASVLGPSGDTLSSLNSGVFVYPCQATVTRAEVGPYCEGDSLKYMFHLVHKKCLEDGMTQK